MLASYSADFFSATACATIKKKGPICCICPELFLTLRGRSATFRVLLSSEMLQALFANNTCEKRRKYTVRYVRIYTWEPKAGLWWQKTSHSTLNFLTSPAAPVEGRGWGHQNSFPSHSLCYSSCVQALVWTTATITGTPGWSLCLALQHPPFPTFSTAAFSLELVPGAVCGVHQRAAAALPRTRRAHSHMAKEVL